MEKLIDIKGTELGNKAISAYYRSCKRTWPAEVPQQPSDVDQDDLGYVWLSNCNGTYAIMRPSYTRRGVRFTRVNDDEAFSDMVELRKQDEVDGELADEQPRTRGRHMHVSAETLAKLQQEYVYEEEDYSFSDTVSAAINQGHKLSNVDARLYEMASALGLPVGQGTMELLDLVLDTLERRALFAEAKLRQISSLAKPAAPARPTLNAAMAAAGFVVHPEHPDFCHNGVEALPVAALRSRLAA